MTGPKKSFIRVADLVAQILVDQGVQHVFLVTGGAAMHLNDAIGRCDGLEYVACHHEQACAMAAESYFRANGRLAAVNVTAGPGGTNTITGVWGAYVDSCGMVVISGQAKRETMARSYDLPLRQLGDQEIDIVRVVEPITKYATCVTKPDDIRYEIEKAIYLARSGRPGPTWVDIPGDVQGALVDPLTLRPFDSTQVEEHPVPLQGTAVEAAAADVVARLARAERPVILAGGGIRISGGYEAFLQLVDHLQVPVTTAWNSHDLIWDDHPLYVGRPGTIGDRSGNFAVQSSDFLLVLGCRLNIRQISYAWEHFARAAELVMVDIDEAELRKPTVSVDVPVHADVAEFMRAVLARPAPTPSPAHQRYLSWCKERQRRYPVVLPEYRQAGEPVNPYCFVETLFEHLEDGEVVVTGDGTACVTTFQAARIRPGQRLWTNSGCAAMGYDLPAAVGAYYALQPSRVVCIAGDGSIQMNLAELQTIASHGLPIKIFLLNNRGYHSIRQTQSNYFPDNIVGCGTESGLGFPDPEQLAKAFRFGFGRIAVHDDLELGIKAALTSEGPYLCEVVLDLRQQFSPKLSSRKLDDGRMISAPLEDLAPFLSRDELAENLLVPPVEQ